MGSHHGDRRFRAAGHGARTPMSIVLDQYADYYSFLFARLGIRFQTDRPPTCSAPAVFVANPHLSAACSRSTNGSPEKDG